MISIIFRIKLYFPQYFFTFLHILEFNIDFNKFNVFFHISYKSVLIKLKIK